MADPIWKDNYITLGNNDSYQYRILLEDTGEVIYSGKAYKRPGESNVKIRINDVCADYLQNVLPTLSQAEFSELTLPVKFETQIYSSGQWRTKRSVHFLNDWSYDYNYNAATMGMSFPINGRIDGRMPIVWTGVSVSQVTATIYYKDGTSSSIIIPVEITADFNADFNSDFAKSARAAGSGTAVFFPSAWDDVDRIVVGNSTFKVTTECAKYALYYINAYGGWDSLLIEGNDLESDSLVRHTREMVYDNGDIQNRGIENYVNEVTKRFTLHTGWMTDAESSLMHHLINSTDVYLYDIAAEQMIPVLVTDNSVDYKTYHNQGNRMVNYTIQVEVAQNRIRR